MPETATPTLLDLFCCQGGAAMGYHRAGFRVVGVDIKPQPRYPFEFVQADALDFLEKHGRSFDAIHASPPCQAFSTLKGMPNAKEHPNLIPQTRELLIATGKPYVIENVPKAPLVDAVLLCGTMFGLRTSCGAELRRHRLFETNWLLMCGLTCRHGATVCTVTGHTAMNHSARWERRVISVYGGKARDRAVGQSVERVSLDERSGPRTICVTGKTAWAGKLRPRTITVTGSTPQQNVVRNEKRETFSVQAAREAMGIDWMGMKGLSQAIPPAYTEFIGRQLINVVEVQYA
jgi:DNA (cytosine-5)-methyltransferase 1